jgi:hypothetical protein
VKKPAVAAAMAAQPACGSRRASGNPGGPRLSRGTVAPSAAPDPVRRFFITINNHRSEVLVEELD